MDISPRIVISVPLYAHKTINFQIYEHLKLRKEHLIMFRDYFFFHIRAARNAIIAVCIT